VLGTIIEITDRVEYMKPEEKAELLAKIEAEHTNVWEAISKLQYEQHQYLEASGFQIEPILENGEYLGHTYSIEDEIFTDEDHAIEWLEEQGE